MRQTFFCAQFENYLKWTCKSKLCCQNRFWQRFSAISASKAALSCAVQWKRYWKKIGCQRQQQQQQKNTEKATVCEQTRQMSHQWHLKRKHGGGSLARGVIEGLPGSAAATGCQVAPGSAAFSTVWDCGIWNIKQARWGWGGGHGWEGMVSPWYV